MKRMRAKQNVNVTVILAIQIQWCVGDIARG